MAFENCTQCGKLSVQLVRGVCSACLEADDQMYRTVTEYLRRNPDADVTSIASDTGVTEKKVLEFLRTGRLSVKGGLSCERCGEPVHTGKLCERCAAVVQGQLRGASETTVMGKGPSGTIFRGEQERAGGKMHTLDLTRRKFGKTGR